MPASTATTTVRRKRASRRARPRSQSVQTVARCIIDLHDAPAGTQNVWALVDVPQGSPGATYSVTLSGAVPMIPLSATTTATIFNNAPFVVTGPGHVAASTNFPIRLAWGGATTDSQSFIVPGNYYGAILIDAAPGSQQGLAGFVPFAFTRNSGGDDVADALHSGALHSLHYSPVSTTLQHVFIDVPVGATSLEVDTSLDIAADTQVSFAVVRADFPPSSASPQVAAAPNTAPAASWVLNSITQSNKTVVPVTPGRWYLVSQYSSSRADASVTAQCATDIRRSDAADTDAGQLLQSATFRTRHLPQPGRRPAGRRLVYISAKTARRPGISRKALRLPAESVPGAPICIA